MYQSMAGRVRDAFRHMGFMHLDRRAVVGATVIFAVLVTVLIVFIATRSNRAVDSFSISSSGKTGDSGVTASATQLPVSDTISVKKIYVHVVGAVNAPGVYELPEGSRIVDAIEYAQGSTQDASLVVLNLAHKLADGDQVYLPTIDEATVGRTHYGLMISQLVGSMNVVSSISNSGGAVSQTSNTTGKININSATADQLDQLPGVGPVIAQAIITYRENNGSFETISDLQSVSGIGEKKYAQIVDYVCI